MTNDISMITWLESSSHHTNGSDRSDAINILWLMSREPNNKLEEETVRVM